MEIFISEENVNPVLPPGVKIMRLLLWADIMYTCDVVKMLFKHLSKSIQFKYWGILSQQNIRSTQEWIQFFVLFRGGALTILEAWNLKIFHFPKIFGKRIIFKSKKLLHFPQKIAKKDFPKKLG
jgi:hypothetical protein